MLGFTGFVSLAAVGVPEGKDTGYGFCSKHGNYKGPSCPGCASASNSSQTGNNSYDPNQVTLFNLFSKMKEKKREARERQAYDANEEGIQYAKNGDFAKALAAYERAAKFDPTDSVIQSNLAKARARQHEMEEHTHAEQQREKQNAEATKRMQQSIQALAQSLTATSVAKPSISGLDFDNGNTSSIASASSSGLEFSATIAAAPNTDPMVVDVRNVLSGLPKEIEESIPRTPAGNRVRKGFQAIVDHDWRLALAWFQDAYTREPGDPSLQRLVELAQFTLDYQTGNSPLPGRTEQSKSNESLASVPDSKYQSTDGNPNMIPMTRDNVIARIAANRMAASSRVQEVYEELHKKYGDGGAYWSARLSPETNYRLLKAKNGEGLSRDELDRQFEEALTRYLREHPKYDTSGVGGSATAEEIILGGKG